MPNSQDLAVSLCGAMADDWPLRKAGRFLLPPVGALRSGAALLTASFEY